MKRATGTTARQWRPVLCCRRGEGSAGAPALAATNPGAHVRTSNHARVIVCDNHTVFHFPHMAAPTTTDAPHHPGSLRDIKQAALRRVEDLRQQAESAVSTRQQWEVDTKARMLLQHLPAVLLGSAASSAVRRAISDAFLSDARAVASPQGTRTPWIGTLRAVAVACGWNGGQASPLTAPTVRMGTRACWMQLAQLCTRDPTRAPKGQGADAAAVVRGVHQCGACEVPQLAWRGGQ